jgi:hypothetical protein
MILVRVIVLILWASTVFAQQTSSIGGSVVDASGGVLPGVTVEAASPALILTAGAVVVRATNWHRHHQHRAAVHRHLARRHEGRLRREPAPLRASPRP